MLGRLPIAAMISPLSCVLFGLIFLGIGIVVSISIRPQSRKYRYFFILALRRKSNHDPPPVWLARLMGTAAGMIACGIAGIVFGLVRML